MTRFTDAGAIIGDSGIEFHEGVGDYYSHYGPFPATEEWAKALEWYLEVLQLEYQPRQLLLPFKSI